LGTRDATYDKIEDMLRQGADIKMTQLTEEFTFSDFQQRNAGRYIPLMLIRKKQVQVCTVMTPLTPEPGWTLVSLLLEAEAIDDAPSSMTQPGEQLTVEHAM
jgi:CPA1 family monovalent cation:H+ antiporter